MRFFKKASAVVLAATILSGAAMEQPVLEKIGIVSTMSADAYDNNYYGPALTTHTSTYKGVNYEKLRAEEKSIATISTSNRLFGWPISSSYSGYNSISGSYRDDQWNGYSYESRNHGAIDIAVTPTNTPVPVLAVYGGTVYKVGSNFSTDGGYGNYIILKHTVNGKTIYTQYSHLNSTYVLEGATVKKGAQIGEVGNTGAIGWSYDYHLDFQVKGDPDRYNERYDGFMSTNYDPIKICQLPATLKIGTTAYGSWAYAGNPEIVGAWIANLAQKGVADPCPSWAKSGGTTTTAPVTTTTTRTTTTTTAANKVVKFPYDSNTAANYKDASISNFTVAPSSRETRLYTYGIRKKNTDSSIYVKITNLTNDTSNKVRVSTYGVNALDWNAKKYNYTLNASGYSVTSVALSKGKAYQVLNMVNEKGYPYAGLTFRSSGPSTQKKLYGYWSPDCYNASAYPVAT